MSFAERFFRENLKAAEERGDEFQLVDMTGLLSVNSQKLGELGDILGGRRNQKVHRHHPVDVLVNAVVSNVTSILKIRREINRKK